MTCENCQSKPNNYYMSCIVCCARHVRMQFYPKDFDMATHLRYLAKKYEFNLDELMVKIRELKDKK